MRRKGDGGELVSEKIRIKKLKHAKGKQVMKISEKKQAREESVNEFLLRGYFFFVLPHAYGLSLYFPPHQLLLNILRSIW